ncbi:LytTR family DNA-binding domain-containing protein [Ekhidna sp. MALMAid0563]|uniref:LytR/AlgR family response regulator transcription factor n=1 Tax=Ekhidna sp. MALMAid0563 TaxID=3143937 RepID=UPI0032DF0034
MNRRTSILLGAFIIGLIFFDAAQQKYYLDTFDLAPNGPVAFGELLSNHLIRWLIWLVVSIPVLFFAWNKVFNKERISNKNWIVIGCLVLLSTLLSITLVSLQSIFSQNLSLAAFSEFFQFFTYQKGLTFLMASILFIGLLYNHSKLKTIDEQSIEIKTLKKVTSDLQEVLSQEEKPHLNVKTGYKLKPIALEDIVWIQSDDYCVKIHTADKTFTLRQSLKALEDKLAPFRFIRIHRSALLNLNYLDQVNFDTAHVRLVNDHEIPYSKSGIKSLKEYMKNLSI